MPNHDKRPRLAALSLTILGALSSLAAGQSVANNSANNPSLNCVSVQVGQLQASDANFATSLGLSIKNGCGKDISAVGINFGPNQVTQWDWIEMLLFKDQLPENGILLTGTTKQLWIPGIGSLWTPPGPLPFPLSFLWTGQRLATQRPYREESQRDKI